MTYIILAYDMLHIRLISKHDWGHGSCFKLRPNYCYIPYKHVAK